MESRKIADLTPLEKVYYTTTNENELPVLCNLITSLENGSSSPRHFYESGQARKVLSDEGLEGLGRVLNSIEEAKGGKVLDLPDTVKPKPKPKRPTFKPRKIGRCEIMRKIGGKGVKIIDLMEEEEKAKGDDGGSDLTGKGKEKLQDEAEKVAAPPDKEEEWWGFTISNPPPKMYFPSENAKVGNKKVRSGIEVDESKIDEYYLEFLKYVDRKFHPSD